MRNLGDEHLMDRTLRWMKDNLEGAYDAKYPEDHEKSGEHCTNSGTALIIFCYINILGKVLLKGGPTRGNGVSRDRLRFVEFLQQCMPDFIQESSTYRFPQRDHGATTGQDWLYTVFRCGFVHQFYPSKTDGWSRFPRSNKYWHDVDSNRVVLNIDQLKRGFDHGIQKFRAITQQRQELREHFEEYILKA